MAVYPKHVWDQLRAKTCDDIIKALEKDGWVFEGAKGAVHYFRKGEKPITVHRHPTGEGYGANLLKALFDQAGWTTDDLKRLKLIKRN